MAEISGAGVKVSVPSGWDARVTSRPGDAAYPAAQGGAEPSLTHVGSFPLPEQRGDFGSGAVELMRTTDAFVSLFEYLPSSKDEALYRNEGLPAPLTLSDFDEQALQRPQAGQVGVQRFFRIGERRFCLYVVLGHRVAAARQLGRINQLVADLRFD